MTKFIITTVLVAVAAIILLPNLCLKAYAWVLSSLLWAWSVPSSYAWAYVCKTYAAIKAFDAKFAAKDPIALEAPATDSKVA